MDLVVGQATMGSINVCQKMRALLVRSDLEMKVDDAFVGCRQLSGDC